ncbi:MAG: hypothetical protein ACREDK_07945 [Thermoplasmata archaeon]
MPFRVESIDEADVEFLAIPPEVREVFIVAFRELTAGDAPVIAGVGWRVEALRQNQRIAPEGLYALHVGDLWRGVFFRRAGALVFVAFGFRLPDFYRKLRRLRVAIGDESTPT